MTPVIQDILKKRAGAQAEAPFNQIVQQMGGDLTKAIPEAVRRNVQIPNAYKTQYAGLITAAQKELERKRGEAAGEPLVRPGKVETKKEEEQAAQDIRWTYKLKEMAAKEDQDIRKAVRNLKLKQAAKGSDMIPQKALDNMVVYDKDGKPVDKASMTYDQLDQIRSSGGWTTTPDFFQKHVGTPVSQLKKPPATRPLEDRPAAREALTPRTTQDQATDWIGGGP